jgi:2-polyprenyl-6-hydroxyphenyl methylase/3-demethylubiquinone-9 3-methyltransferase
MTLHEREIARGERFRFGENWARFLAEIDDDRIDSARASLERMLDGRSLSGRRFLDVGSGSGLSSLAARSLGATVHSFDFDPKSVECTRELKRRYFPNDDAWTIEEGSALDPDYLRSLGRFDVVYSWGVLHHTGQMWQALDNVAPLVDDGGALFIAIYNTQAHWTPMWTRVKRLYNRLPRFLRAPYALLVALPLEFRSFGYHLIRGDVGRYFRAWTGTDARGMHHWRDTVDWVGGWPFETARPEEILDFYRARGFVLERLKTCGGGLGCNEFVFVRMPPASQRIT